MKIQQSLSPLTVLSLRNAKDNISDQGSVETEFKEELIGKIIKRARERQKITQESLAEQLGINKSNISKIENNLTSIRMGTFFKLMQALDTKITLKLEFESSPNKVQD